MNIVLIGVGLIGGSMALDIKDRYKNAHITGVDLNPQNNQRAFELGIIDSLGSLEESVPTADIILVSIPVNHIASVVRKCLDVMNSEAFIFDVGSTKEQICKDIQDHPKRHQFLATHPIAGTEYSGPEAAFRGLFVNKTQIICEAEKTTPEFVKKAEEIFENIGMNLVYMQPQEHDKHIAYVSHLSHISSFMLGKTVLEEEKNEKDIFDMAGSGFASTVRLAKSSPAMWTPIFLENKTFVTKALRAYIKNLELFEGLLETNHKTALFEEMKAINHIKKVLQNIEKK